MNLFKNKRILFTLNRYFSYFIKFFQGLIIAKLLGPFYLGVWGVVIVFLQYFQYSILGTQYALNVELSILDKDDDKVKLGVNIFNSFVITFFFGIILFLFSVILYIVEPPFLLKYGLQNLIIPIFVLGILNTVCLVFVNIYRSYDEFFKIGVTELTYNLFPFLTLFFFKDEKLVSTLIYTMLGTRIVHIILYSYKFNFPITFKFDFKKALFLIKTGFGLMMINIGYQIFFITSKTFVAQNYTVEQMGMFTFCFTLTNAVVLGSQTLLFTIYSKMLNEFANDKSDPKIVVDKLNFKSKAYNYGVSILILTVVSFTPLIFYFFNKYKEAADVLVIILIAQIFFTSGTIHGAYTFAHKMQKYVVNLSLIFTSIALLFFYIASLYKLQLVYLSFIILIFSIVYSYIQVRASHKILCQDINLHLFFKNNIGYNALAFLIIILSIVIFDFELYYLIFTLPFYLLLNFKNLRLHLGEIKTLLS